MRLDRVVLNITGGLSPLRYAVYSYADMWALSEGSGEVSLFSSLRSALSSLLAFVVGDDLERAILVDKLLDFIELNDPVVVILSVSSSGSMYMGYGCSEDEALDMLYDFPREFI